MKEQDAAGEAYVRKMLEATRRFGRDLLAQNERLGRLAAELEGEKERLQEELDAFGEQLERHQSEQARSHRQLAEIEEENCRFSREFVEVQQQNSNLAHLYVASFRLQRTLDRNEILDTIQEIIVNLIGSEEMAIFELDSEKSLGLTRSLGIDAPSYRRVPLGAGAIGRAALTGEPFFSAGVQVDEARAKTEDGLTACIPLKVDGQVTGAIAVFRLLQQKTGLAAIDHELFDLLASPAAVALYCSGLRMRLDAGAVQTT
jgi:hypothetical protein